MSYINKVGRNFNVIGNYENVAYVPVDSSNVQDSYDDDLKDEIIDYIISNV